MQKMGLKKKIVNFVPLLMVLTASSASVSIVNNYTITTEEIVQSREEKMARYRLPNSTMPRLYHIHIEPNMDDENLTWAGKTSIDIEIVVPTPQLILHAYKNLVIDENFTKLVDADGRKFTPVEHSRDDELEFLKLQFDRVILVGNYSLSIKYEGEDTGNFFGFYMASDSFEDAPSIAATHFQPTSARRAFPCWDEPVLKARFRVSIKHFQNYTAVSNMPESEHVETPDGKILTTFATTPIMSTYLLTFVISDSQWTIDEHPNASLYTSKGGLDEVKHVIDLSPKIVNFMESYTGFPFGCPRIGSVILPAYTDAALATENWGLISYSEKSIGINAILDTTLQKDLALMTVAHELSHSWFGNRVTPLWWNDIWINEAFATYFQYFIMDEIYENWNGMQLFVLHNNQEMAYYVDTEDQIPIRWSPSTNKEIELLFGQTIYRKGSALVHMFRNVLGDNIFRAGIQKFMSKYSFKAATAEDLMATFQEAYNEDTNKKKPLNVEETMSPWLVQKGHPIVNVTRNYTTGETVVSQRSTIIEDSSSKWWIPLTYATKSSPNFSSTLPVSWISNKEDRVMIDGINKDDWVVLNVQASGFYRVNYDDENWNRLADYLNTDNYTNIHVLNRAQLIDDAFYLTELDPQRHFRNFYKLTKYLSREVEYLPWRSAYFALIRIESSFSHPEIQKQFERYILGLMHSFVEKVGFEMRDTDDHFTKLSRADIIQTACLYGHVGCSEYAAQKLIKVAQNPEENQLGPDIKVWLFCAGVRGLNATTALQIANSTHMNRKRVISFVDCTENHEIHRYFLNGSLMNNSIADLNQVFGMLVSSTEENFNFAVDYFLENHQVMNNSDSTNVWLYDIPTMVSDIAQATETTARLEKLKVVLLLDAVLQHPKINTTSLMEIAEKKVANSESFAAQFMQFFEDPADNSTSS